MNDLELKHYGVKGQKWGVRRYQNPDGTLTDAGKKRLYKSLKEHSKIESSRLGGMVGKDATVTEAARKVKATANKCAEAASRFGKIQSKMEQMHFDEYERLNKKYGDSKPDSSKRNQAWETVLKKYGKEHDRLESEYHEAAMEYDKALKTVVDAYIGKYGNKPITTLRNGITTARQELADQIDWGIHTGRLKED